jgi:acetyl-CoA synthetase
MTPAWTPGDTTAGSGPGGETSARPAAARAPGAARPARSILRESFVSRLEYEELLERSLADPAGFWGERAAAMLDWVSPWEEVVHGGFGADAGAGACASWFAGGTLNAAYNCVDRHVEAGLGDKPAMVFEAVDGSTDVFTYARLLEETARFAGVLRSRGVGERDTVVLYLPMIPELPIAMLACARVGAVHSVVFAGFSSQVLKARIASCGASTVVTAEAGWRRGAPRALKDEVDRAAADAPGVQSVIVVPSRARLAASTGGSAVSGGPAMAPGRDLWWHEAMEAQRGEPVVPCLPVAATHPLFIVWTSGSSGATKGVVHATGGYLLFAAETYSVVFEPREPDVHFCAADVGWITGHTYLVYGPLAVGATTLLYEGVPTAPDPKRLFDLITRHGVATLCTTPSVLHAMMVAGDDWARTHGSPVLRIVASTGDPLSPEASTWFRTHMAAQDCAVLDTWWQTETGGILLWPPPGLEIGEPESASRPFFGVDPVVLRNDGLPADPGEVGNLCLRQPWPGIMRGIWGDDASGSGCRALYFSRFDGLYSTGDQASADGRGGFRVEGASGDDVWVSGQRVSSAELERALMGDPRVVEAAVVGFPDPAKGEGVYCYLVLRDDAEPTAALCDALVERVADVIGPFAVPDKVHFVPALPKSRSGKLVRRVLRKIAEGDPGGLGDTSTLADPGAVDDLRNGSVSRIWTIDAEARS